MSPYFCRLLTWGSICSTGVCEIKAPGPCKLIGFGAIDVTKPYKSIGFADIDGPKSYEFTGPGGFYFANTGILRFQRPTKTLQTVKALSNYSHRVAVISGFEILVLMAEQKMPRDGIRIGLLG